MQKIMLGIFVGIICVIRWISYEHVHTSEIPNDWFNKQITITGSIVKDPDRGLETVTAYLAPIDSEGVPMDHSKIILRMLYGADGEYGDMVSVTGVIKQPENFMTDTGREFQYVQYLTREDVYGIMTVSHSEILERGTKNSIIQKIFELKRGIVGTLKKIFPKNEAGLLAGILLGEQSLLPKDVMSNFQIAGLTHMVVLSGYNITIIITLMSTFFAYMKLGYRGRRIGVLGIMPFFLVMTGLGASSVRAGIMASVLILLELMTRPAHHLRMIAYTAGIMIFINPRIMLHDPGFHLSFLAFIGLVYVTPLMNSWCNKNKSEFFLKKIIIETASVQMTVLPYIIWMNGQVSLLSLLANSVTIPVIPFLMAGGMMSLLGVMMGGPVGILVAIPVTWGLAYVIQVAEYTAKVTSATLLIPPFGVGIMVGWYFIMLIGVVWWYKTCNE